MLFSLKITSQGDYSYEVYGIEEFTPYAPIKYEEKLLIYIPDFSRAPTHEILIRFMDWPGHRNV